MKDHLSRHGDIALWKERLRPRVAQHNVRLTGDYANATVATVRLDGVRLTAILEIECHRRPDGDDQELWAHLSVCAQSPRRLPSWKELRWCKEYFIGDTKAIQVLPPRAEYVNIHPHVLHLFAPLERDPLPDFRMIQPSGEEGL